MRLKLGYLLPYFFLCRHFLCILTDWIVESMNHFFCILPSFCFCLLYVPLIFRCSFCGSPSPSCFYLPRVSAHNRNMSFQEYLDQSISLVLKSSVLFLLTRIVLLMFEWLSLESWLTILKNVSSKACADKIKQFLSKKKLT